MRSFSDSDDLYILILLILIYERWNARFRVAFGMVSGKILYLHKRKNLMRKLLYIIIALAVAIAAQAQDVGQIEARLKAIAQQDQQVCLQLVGAQQAGKVDSLLHYAEQMVRIDAENQAYVAQLMAGGIPEELSDEAYEAIYLVVDHADIDFQKRYFKPLRAAAREGKLRQSSINTLHDRMLMRRNRRQIYGTQTWSHTTIIEGEPAPVQINYVWPVRGARSVDARRIKANMGTMQRQTEAHERMGYRVVWDRTMSVREFRRMMEQR